MKNTNKLINFLNDALISLSISFGLIIFLEVFYRFLRKSNFNYAQNKEEIIKFQKIAFDNKFSDEEIKELNSSYGIYNGINYQPWIQIGNAAHENKYSIVKNGNRETLNFSNNCENPKVYWFFGGSTTYGTGVAWQDTLPSKFAENLNSNSICGYVLNFGVPYHYSLQESIFFASELAKSDNLLPDYVFFIDGLNDFLQVGSSIKKEPFFSPMFSKYFGKDSIGTLKNLDKPIISFNFALADYISSKIGLFHKINPSNYQKPSNLNNLEIVESISKNMLDSNKFRAKLCKVYKIQCFQFLQPVPFLGYERKYNETLTIKIDPERRKLFKMGYENILNNKSKSNEIGLIVNDASKILSNYKDGIPYVDIFHYSPRANDYFAKHILKIVFEN